MGGEEPKEFADEDAPRLQPDTTGPGSAEGSLEAAPNAEEKDAAQKGRKLSQCAGFCANQPENCNTMSLWCGGCPVCRRLKGEEPKEFADEVAPRLQPDTTGPGSVEGSLEAAP